MWHSPVLSQARDKYQVSDTLGKDNQAILICEGDFKLALKLKTV